MRRMGLAEQVRFSRASTVSPSKSGLRYKMQEKTPGKLADVQSQHLGRDTDARGIVRRRGTLMPRMGVAEQVRFGRTSPVLAEQVRFSRANTVCATRCKRRHLASRQTPKAGTLDKIPTLGTSLRLRGMLMPRMGVAEQVRFSRTSPV